jgi:phosphatidylglycerol lysyltransferase
VRAHGRRFYNFEGLDRFKAKFAPERWEPVYAIANEGRFSARSLHAIAHAFSGGSPTWLVLRSLARAARTELRWLFASK